jgi:hypothetical protein
MKLGLLEAASRFEIGDKRRQAAAFVEVAKSARSIVGLERVN